MFALPASHVINIFMPSPSSTNPMPARQLRQDDVVGGGMIKVGRVDFVFTDTYTYRVSFENRGLVTAISLSSAFAAWSGARDVSPLSHGTRVLVFMLPKKDFAIILGAIPPDDPQALSANIAPEGGIHPSSDNLTMSASKAGMGGDHPDFSHGSPIDALPGDRVILNEYGVMIGVLQFLATLKASELAKIEAFVMDDLLRLVGHNMDVFSSLGEMRVRSDHGRITLEFGATGSQKESLGVINEEKVGKEQDVDPEGEPDKSSYAANVADAIGRWRLKGWVGALGDFIQAFLVRPSETLGSLSSTEKDMGLFHAHLHSSGLYVVRNLTGAGMLKTTGIAVPKRIRTHEDPEGDGEIEERQKVDFQFNPENPFFKAAQLRDYFAWVYDNYGPSRMKDQVKDMSVPGDAEAVSPGDPAVAPSIGNGFFAPEGVAAKTPEDSGSQSFNKNTAWLFILPDGSISWRDGWGTTIESYGGHLIISAPKDIVMMSGRNLVGMGGHDVVMKARESMDLSATNKQVRVKSQGSAFFHSEAGGIMMSAKGKLFKDGTGESGEVPGIVFKSDSEIKFVAGAVNFALTATFSITSQGGKSGPIAFMVDSDVVLFKGLTSCLFDTGSSLVAIDTSGLRSSENVFAEKGLMVNGTCVLGGNITSNGSLQIGGNVLAGGRGAFGGGVAGTRHSAAGIPTKPAPSPVISATAGQSYSRVLGSLTEEFFNQNFSLDLQIKTSFSFRSVSECGTDGGMWTESHWQREMGGLSVWTEVPVNETYPYPGKEHYEGNSLKVYTPGNVDVSGNPKAPDSQTVTGGKFEGKPFSQLKVHP